MPVTSTHKSYNRYLPTWQMLRDLAMGEEALKTGGTLYLPMLSGQKREHYEVYKERNTLYNAFARSVDGLLGLLERQPPVVELQSETLRLWLDDITLSGIPLSAFISTTLKEMLSPSRYGVLVDMPVKEGNRPKFSGYTAESIELWREEVRDGVKILTLVKLKECEEKVDPDGFGSEEQEIYRVLDLDESGFYRQRIYYKPDVTKDEWVLREIIYPNKRQKTRLTFIPFKIFGAFDLTPDCEPPLLLDLAYTNLAHYRESADYWHKLHWNSIAQPVVFTRRENPVLYFGGGTAWPLDPGDAAMILESSGAGIDAHERALDKLEGRMARLGAELLDIPKEGVEAAETARLRQSSRGSILSSIAETASRGLTQCLQWYTWWAGYAETPETAEVSVKVNNEFVESKLSPADLLSFVQAWQQRGISQKTYLYNVKRGGLLPEYQSVEQEILDIEAEAPPQPQTEPDNLAEQQAA